MLNQANPRKISSRARALELVLEHVTHKLRLQPLRTELSADMQSPLSIRQFFVPGGQRKNRTVESAEGGPHEPPTVCGPFQQTAVWSGTTVEGASRRHFSSKASTLTPTVILAPPNGLRSLLDRREMRILPFPRSPTFPAQPAFGPYRPPRSNPIFAAMPPRQSRYPYDRTVLSGSFAFR